MKMDGDVRRVVFHTVEQIERCVDVPGFEGKWAVIRWNVVQSMTGSVLRHTRTAVSVHDTLDGAKFEADKRGLEPRQVA